MAFLESIQVSSKKVNVKYFKIFRFDLKATGYKFLSTQNPDLGG